MVAAVAGLPRKGQYIARFDSFANPFAGDGVAPDDFGYATSSPIYIILVENESFSYLFVLSEQIFVSLQTNLRQQSHGI